MKIALITHYLPTNLEDYTLLANKTIPERDKYCSKHGYEHIVQKGDYKYPNMYYAYQRLHLLIDLMESRPDIDVFFILNVQAVITNHNRKIEEFISEENSFFITRDINGINAGSFIVKNNRDGRGFISFVIAQEQNYRNDCWHEQRCIQHNENNPLFKGIIKVLDHPSINSYFYDLYKWPDSTPGYWKYGDFILSLPGLNLQQRLDLVDSDRVKNGIIY